MSYNLHDHIDLFVGSFQHSLQVTKNNSIYTWTNSMILHGL